jgi:hypothetical protein
MALRQFGEMRAEAPWFYIPAVLVSKFSPVQVLVFVVEFLLVVGLWLLGKRKARVLHVVCLVSLLPIVPLAIKGFQNAHYYVALVPTVMIFTALALERWLRSSRRFVPPLVLGLSSVTLVSQIATCRYLAPDYLMAGRQFGEFFYGQFSGPVVNHCQGLPFAIREINHLIEKEGGPRTAYILRSCMGVMAHALERGPVQAVTPIGPYPAGGGKVPHYLVIPGSYDYDNLGANEQASYTKLRLDLTQGCERAGHGHVDYELWLCPSRS